MQFGAVETAFGMRVRTIHRRQKEFGDGPENMLDS